MSSKSVLITGGTGKVGKQLVQHFLKKNYNVIFTSRSKEKADSVIKEFAEINSNKNLYSIVVDLVSEKAIDKIISWCENNSKWPNILINNARNLEYLKVENGYVSRRNWIGEFTLDVIVPYELTMAIAQHQNSRLESVINISSMYGVVPPNPNLYEDPKYQSPINYGVAKAAQIHLTKELSIRLAPNIRVNAISYGGIEGRVDESFKQRYASFCPMGRMLRDHEVIGAADFLASDNSIGMTGQNLIVDGGWTVW